MWSPPRPIGGSIIVHPLRQYMADGSELRHSSGLYLGRDVDHPLGHVLRVSPWVEAHLPDIYVGARILWVRDANADFGHDGVRLNRIDERGVCPHCSAYVQRGQVLATVGPHGELGAIGSRVIVQRDVEQRSSIVWAGDDVERHTGTVVSVGASARDLAVGARVAIRVRGGASVRLRDGRSFAVVDTADGCPRCGRSSFDGPEVLAVVAV